MSPSTRISKGSSHQILAMISESCVKILVILLKTSLVLELEAGDRVTRLLRWMGGK